MMMPWKQKMMRKKSKRWYHILRFIEYDLRMMSASFLWCTEYGNCYRGYTVNISFWILKLNRYSMAKKRTFIIKIEYLWFLSNNMMMMMMMMMMMIKGKKMRSTVMMMTWVGRWDEQLLNVWMLSSEPGTRCWWNSTKMCHLHSSQGLKVSAILYVKISDTWSFITLCKVWTCESLSLE